MKNKKLPLTSHSFLTSILFSYFCLQQKSLKNCYRDFLHFLCVHAFSIPCSNKSILVKITSVVISLNSMVRSQASPFLVYWHTEHSWFFIPSHNLFSLLFRSSYVCSLSSLFFAICWWHLFTPSFLNTVLHLCYLYFLVNHFLDFKCWKTPSYINLSLHFWTLESLLTSYHSVSK
jgi:hypothetical protein